MNDLTADDVVGEIEERLHEPAVTIDALGPHSVTIGLISGRPLDHEPTLRSGRHDDGVLHHLRLHQTEHLGTEVLRTVAPANPAACDAPTAQMDALDLRRTHEDLELGPREWEEGDRVRAQLDCHLVTAEKGVRPVGGIDERQERPTDPVVVE